MIKLRLSKETLSEVTGGTIVTVVCSEVAQTCASSNDHTCVSCVKINSCISCGIGITNCAGKQKTYLH